MEVILLGNIKKLGTIGSVVKVKDGFGRNYLIPQKMAMRATANNLKIVEEKKAHLIEENKKNLNSAKEIANEVDGVFISIIRSASESGHLYGSIRSQDIVDALDLKNFKVKKNHVNIKTPIKTIGLHKVYLNLHTEIDISINVIVAQSDEEAQMQLPDQES